MSSASLAARADTTVPATPAPLVISVRADEQGAREAARWAERLEGATALVSSDADLERRAGAAPRILVLDPGMIASWRGFGARASSKERLRLVARLADRTDRITWAATGSEAARWVGQPA